MSEITVNNIGGLYIDGAGVVHTLIGYCDQPTATLENLSHQIVDAAVDSLIMNEFKSIGNLDKDKLIDLIEDLYSSLKISASVIDDLKFDLADTKMKYADLRVANLEA